jgi:acetyl esterase/lipase
VTAVLLKYRVPVRAQTPGWEPLQDAQRAISLVRRNALVWGVQPGRVGILGFSAGGHLAVMAALHPNERTYPQDPAVDVEDATPNFVIPIYPAYLTGNQEPLALEAAVQVGDKAPPICLIHAHDDKGRTSSAASALLYLEYKKRGIPAELHVFTHGGHGFGMRQTGHPVAQWPARVGEWMKAMGWLTPVEP